MKFIRELIASKNWDNEPPDEAESSDGEYEEANAATEAESAAPAGKAASPFYSTDDDDWLDEDDEDAPTDASPEDDPIRLMDEIAQDLASDDDEPVSAEVDDMFADDDDDPEEWNIGLSDEDLPPVSQPLPGEPVKFEDEPEDTGEFEAFDIGLDDELDDAFLSDIGTAEEVEAAAVEAVQQDAELSADEKELLVDEIRAAMENVRSAQNDDEGNARPKSDTGLGRGELLASHTRLLNATEQMMEEDDGARRRHAIALMKSAAAATRRDPELRRMSKPTDGDGDQDQASYRNDLADMEPPALGPRRVSQERKAEIAEADMQDDKSDPLTDETGLGVDAESDLDAGAEPEMPDVPVDLSGLRDALIGAGKKPDAAAQVDAGSDSDTPPETEPEGTELPDIAAATAAAWDADAADSAAPSEPAISVPPPAMGRSRRQAGRVKTRLIGFQGGEAEDSDPFAADAATPTGNIDVKFPVGWLVVVEGPGYGHCFSLTTGVAQIGRGADQTVRLNFGDTAISRQNHAAVAFDDEDGLFYLGHGGKANLVRLNGKPVLATEELKSGDRIRIGETTLHFVALCNEEFTWRREGNGDVGTAAIA